MADYGKQLIATGEWVGFELNVDRAPVALSGYRWVEVPGINASWLRKDINSALKGAVHGWQDQMHFWTDQVNEVGKVQTSSDVAKAHDFLVWCWRYGWLFLQNKGTLNNTAAKRILWARGIGQGAANVRSAPQFFLISKTINNTPTLPSAWGYLSSRSFVPRNLGSLIAWNGVWGNWETLLGDSDIHDRTWIENLV